MGILLQGAGPILSIPGCIIKRENAISWPVGNQEQTNHGKIGLMTNANTAFTALWHPFCVGAIEWRDPCLFLRARSGPVPSEITGWEQIDCQQSFKPFVDELEKAGCSIVKGFQKTYSMVIVLPPPQRDEMRALFVSALQHLEDDGIVVVSMENNEGAKSGEKDLRQLAPNLQSISKNKCRVFWVNKKNLDEQLMQCWAELDAPRMIDATGFVSRPGIFAWNRIDAASKLLADYLPKDLSGHGADIGAGFGYLTHTVLVQNDNIESMDVFEAEARALDCAKLNLLRFEGKTKLTYHWHDVTQGIQGPYDFVISNPPFHQGHDEVQAVGQAFIMVAAKSLKTKGRFYMVANRHLPYEAVLKKYFSHVSLMAMQDGYKIFEAIK
jgi:16S rRNA (guanine1207-N2)-methyltransferase